jgi:hypothetical protein
MARTKTRATGGKVQGRCDPPVGMKRMTGREKLHFVPQRLQWLVKQLSLLCKLQRQHAPDTLTDHCYPGTSH